MTAERDAETMATVEDAQMLLLMELCDEFRQAVFARLDPAEPRETIAIAMTAGIMFAGMQAGHLIAMGDYVESPELNQQMSQMLETNFPLGINFGKLRAARQLAALEASMN
ncbi:hypothetical protein [Sphingopyxis macrogoltabida]|uniref:Uncharacterized protein n=1 Tax=Sphingopyxis macrogoltabida TaxID=33050 RepID=A0A0N9V2D4_SPHMC|nr:hypothetical protein [Sphingopyxis macrogoltabida]ALH82934.1 hypothetical protein AN936_22025 [Sphingopyxis macrogoltabida]